MFPWFRYRDHKNNKIAPRSTPPEKGWGEAPAISTGLAKLNWPGGRVSAYDRRKDPTAVACDINRYHGSAQCHRSAAFSTDKTAGAG